MRKFVILLPLILAVLLLLISQIPQGFSIINEANHPWYTSYTSAIFPYLGIFFLPISLGIDLIGLTGLGLGLVYIVASFIYATLLSYVLYRIFNRFKKAK